MSNDAHGMPQTPSRWLLQGPRARCARTHEPHQELPWRNAESPLAHGEICCQHAREQQAGGWRNPGLCAGAACRVARSSMREL